MSGPASRHGSLSVEEYLRLEETSAVRHEFLAGEVYALAGATTRHNRVAGNIFAHLRGAARGGPCRVYMSDVKLRAAADAFYYPDVMVACTPAEEPLLVIEAPCLLVEVSSPGTAVIDRREKLATYRRIPTLLAYLVVEQDRRRVTRHWRDADGSWGYTEITDHGAVPVPCPETELTLDIIYEDVAMPPLSVAERPGDAG